MRTKLILISVLASLALAPLCHAADAVPEPASQSSTNAPSLLSGPAVDAFEFITTAGVSNWFAVPFATYDCTAHGFGGGVAIGYKLSDFVAPVLRFDYINSGIYSAQADMQLQVPVRILGKIEVVPFTFAGIAAPVSGAGDENWSVVGVVGVGTAVRLHRHWDLVADWEHWTGGPFDSNNQIRFGVLYKF